jgi:N-terminal half of MaoC dehydratase
MVAQRFPIEAGHVQRFARSLGDPAADSGAPLPVPPTFTMANVEFDPEWWLRPQPGAAWFGSGRTAGEPGTGKGLHAEQHFVYHRTPVVGETLRGHNAVGRTWQKDGRRGRLNFVEDVTEWRDDAGDLVVTERRVRVITEGPAPA